MNFRLYVALIIFCLSIMLGMANATCFSGSYPAGAIAAWPMTLTSPGGTTGTGFQYPLSFSVNVLGGNYLIGNILTGTPPGGLWIDTANGLDGYLQMNSNAIGTADNTGYCLYTFSGASPQWNNGLGAASELTSIYGQYDNGNTVMIDYCSFVGSSLCSNYYSYLHSSESISASNGYTINAGSSGYTWLISLSPISGEYLVETYATGWAGGNAEGRMGESTTSSLNTVKGPYDSELLQFYTGNPLNAVWVSAGSAGGVSTSGGNYNYPGLYSMEWVGTGSEIYGINNAYYTGSDASVSDSSSTYAFIGVGGDSSPGYTTGYYIYARQAPPGGITPSVTYGAEQYPGPGPGVASITISNNPVNYGISDLLTATTTNSADAIAIQFCNGSAPCALWTTISAGIGSATNTICATPTLARCWAPGTYNVIANDLITNSIASKVLTITAAPQTMTWTSQCTYPYLQWGSIPNPCTTTATVNTVSSQTIASLYFNGNLNGTTANSISSFLPTNMIGTDTWVFSAPSSANYTANSITYSTTIYVPLYVGNSTNTYMIAPPSNTLAFHYPWILYTASPSNQISFTLNEISPTPAMLQQGLNISYVPPSNQVSATYVYNAIEQQGTSTISIQETIVGNMLVLKNTYPKFNLTGENFTNYAVALFIPNSQWYSKPTNWKFNGFTANVNGNVIDRDGSGNATLPLNVQVTFNGLGTFNLSLNTGLTQNTLSLMPNTYQASNTPPAYPYNGILANITTYDAQSKDQLVATTSYTFTAFINNYTIQVGTLSFTANNFQIYRPISTFQNPPIELLNQTMISSASGYYPQQNNFFANIYNSISYANLHAYLPATVNASYYSITAYKCNGYATGDFVTLQLYGSPSTQVQQYLMSQMPFQLPLLNGYSYQFQVYTPNRDKVYSSPFTLWTSPIQITSACNQSAQVITTPNITTSCSWVYGAAPANQLTATCNGIDTMNLVNSWTIQWVNQTNGLSQYVYNTVTITGSSFTASYTFPDNSISHTYLSVIQMHIGSVSDPDQQNSGILNPLPLAIQPIYGWFILVGMLLLAFVLAYFDKIAFIVILDVVGLVSRLINASPFTNTDITLLLVGSAILIAMAVWKSQGYTVR